VDHANLRDAILRVGVVDQDLGLDRLQVSIRVSAILLTFPQISAAPDAPKVASKISAPVRSTTLRMRSTTGFEVACHRTA
jgi:hypothetical protein